MVPDLYIVGAGGFGRELYSWLKDSSAWGRAWKFVGFLDDNLEALKDFEYPAQVLGPIRGFAPRPGQVFVCGIGNTAVKQRTCLPLIEKGAEFISLVHPTAVVGTNVTFGMGTVICPGVVLTSDISIGDMTMLNLNTTVGHDVEIGSWSTLSPQSNITGGVKIGAGVFLGAAAVILPGLSVGASALVGAGSVVMRDVKPEQSVFGNPARPFS